MQSNFVAGSVEGPSEGIVLAVADHTGTDPLELPCLFDVIDGEALDDLVESLDEGQVQFSFAGCDVTVRADGTVDVAQSSPADSNHGKSGSNGRERAQD